MPNKDLLNKVKEPLIHLMGGYPPLLRNASRKRIPRRTDPEGTCRIRYPEHVTCQRGTRGSRERGDLEKRGNAFLTATA